MKINLASAKPIFSLAALIVIFGTLAFGQSETPFSINTSPLPTPTSPIMDFVGVIDPAAKTALEKRVIDYKAASGVELAVAVVNTTGDRPIEDYSLAVARGWAIGSKEDDNPSALLFVAIDDRRYFTQVSRDLEDELPDGLAGSLQRQYLVPEFKNRNYAKGISDTIEAYIRTIESRRSGTATPTPTPAAGTRSRGTGPGGYTLFCCLAVILVIILIIWSNRRGGGTGKSRRDDDDWGGGGFGGALPWIIGSAIANAASSSSSSSSSDWGSGWGGSSGGSDWGGFGGGGDFGGGGAGGDW
jgi:uncharacterized protein